MIHRGNPELVVTQKQPGEVDWSTLLVMRHPDGEPLSDRQVEILAATAITGSTETSQAILSADIDSFMDLPIYEISLGVRTKPEDAIFDEDRFYALEDVPQREDALRKALASGLGALARVGLPVDELILEEAFLANRQALLTYRWPEDRIVALRAPEHNHTALAAPLFTQEQEEQIVKAFVAEL